VKENKRIKKIKKEKKEITPSRDEVVTDYNRDDRNKSREIIKGERGRNIKRGARKTNRKSQVKGEVASVGNSKSEKGRKVIGAIKKSKSDTGGKGALTQGIH